MPDQIYKSEQAKYTAVVDEIEKAQMPDARYWSEQPLSKHQNDFRGCSNDARIPHNVLNAKYHEREATIIAQAGQAGAVTIATNMAGRGVDILLGGNPEGMAREQLRKENVDLTQIRSADWEAVLRMARAGENPLEQFPDSPLGGGATRQSL